MRRASLAAVVVAALSALAIGPVSAEVAAPPPAPRPWLGISFDGGPGGMPRVTDVHPGTAAAAAGLQPDDHLLSFDGQRLIGDELADLVALQKVGARVEVTYVRDGYPHAATVRLTAKPAIDEIIHRRLIDHVALPVPAYDRDGTLVPGSERSRRPQVWAVFDVRCDGCAAEAAALAARLAESTAEGRPAAPLRVVLVGEPAETAAYLARVPVVGTVWRMDRHTDVDEDPLGPPRRIALGSRYLAGLGHEVNSEGILLVLDGHGVVRYATALSVGEPAHEGACAAAARLARTWRR